MSQKLVKTCSTCQIKKPTSEFYKHKKFKDGLKTQCKECESRRSRLRYEEAKNNGETFIKNKKSSSRSRHLRVTYGITEEQYQELLEKQNCRCAVCGKHEDEFPQKLAVDHNHSTLEIRGLLCRNCNHRVVGRHKDSKLLRAAADYLDNFHTEWLVPKKKRKRRATRTK